MRSDSPYTIFKDCGRRERGRGRKKERNVLPFPYFFRVDEEKQMRQHQQRSTHEIPTIMDFEQLNLYTSVLVRVVESLNFHCSETNPEIRDASCA